MKRILLILLLIPLIHVPANVEKNVVLTYAEPSLFSDFSYQSSDKFMSNQWMSAVYASLVMRNQSSNNGYVPELAVALPTTSDGLTWQFTLKPGIKFASGNPVTVEDIIFSFKVAVTPEINQRSYNFVSQYLDNNSISKITEDTFSITLTTEYGFPMTVFAEPIIEKIVFADRYSNCVSGILSDCSWNNPDGSDAVSAGPFSVESISEDLVELTRNPYYESKSNIDQIRFVYIKEYPITEETMRELGVDIVSPYFFTSMGYFQNMTGFQEETIISTVSMEFSLNHLSPYYGTGLMTPRGMTNSSEAPMAALAVRRAMSAVIDRELFIEVRGGGGIPASSSMPPSSLYGKPSIDADKYDLGRAKLLMQEAGFNYDALNDTDSDGTYETFFFNLTILAPVSHTSSNAHVYLWEQELKKIGIGANVVINDWGFIIKRVFEYNSTASSLYTVPLWDDGGYDVLSIGYGWDLDWDPTGLYENYSLLPEGGNFYNYINLTTQGLIEQYLSELDPTKKADYAYDVRKALHDDLPVIPILHPVYNFALNENVTGVDAILLDHNEMDWSALYIAGIETYETPSSSTPSSNTSPLSTDQTSTAKTYLYFMFNVFTLAVLTFRKTHK